MSEENKERIAKYLARAGVASRRGVEAMIAEGRIQVNGQTLESPAFLVNGSENIHVDGKIIGGQEETRLFLYFKPEGLVTTHKDEKDRTTVFDEIAQLYPELPRLISVGRLDLNTEGLLLLTNNGELARFLELPSTGWVRSYRVRAFGEWNDDKAEKMKKGLVINGIKYGEIIVTQEQPSKGRNHWLTVSLKEGKNREIRNAFDAVGLQVNKLVRTSYGPFRIDGIKKGTVKEATKKQITSSLPQAFFKGGKKK